MKKLVLLGTILLFLPVISLADTVRCNGKMIRPGGSKYDLKKYCGEPDDISLIGSKTYNAQLYETQVITEEWYYSGLNRGKDCVFIITGSLVKSVRKLD